MYTERTTAPAHGSRSPVPTTPASGRPTERAAELLAKYAVDILRISVGLIFLGFGALKFVPGLSPAAAIAERTLETLSFGVLSGESALLTTAVVECLIGITLITGRLLRVGLVLMAGSILGFLSPLVLFFGDMFPSGPTLEAQYILKDIVLAARAS